MDRALEDLFNNADFLAEVRQFRLEHKIPRHGFSDPVKYWKYKKLDGRKKKVEKQAEKMAADRSLPHPYVQWIDAFIGLDFDCTEFVNPFYKDPIPGHAYDMSIGEDYISFRVYKGGTQNGLIRFVRQRWPILEMTMPYIKSNAKAPTVRTKSESKRQRDAEILSLHLAGALRADGSWNHAHGEEPEFLHKKLSWEQRRKIINAQKRRARLEKYRRPTK